MTEEELWQQILVLTEQNKEMATALIRFVDHFLLVWDGSQDARNQVFMKGPFAGGSAGSVSDYGKRMKEIADEVLGQ